MEDKRPKKQTAANRGKSADKSPNRTSKPVSKKENGNSGKGRSAKTSTASSKKEAKDNTPFWAPYAKSEPVKPNHQEAGTERKKTGRKKEEDEFRATRPTPRKPSDSKRFEKPTEERSFPPARSPKRAPRQEEHRQSPPPKKGLWWEQQSASTDRPSTKRDGANRQERSFDEERPRNRKADSHFAERSAPSSRGGREQRNFEEDRPKSRRFDAKGDSSNYPVRTVNRRFSKDEPLAEQPGKAKRFSKPRYANEDKPTTPKRSPKQPKLDEPMRLNKFLAHCGIAARRQSAVYVKQGLVTVNGVVEPNPSYPVKPTDEVRYKGQVVRLEEKKVYILMNKPKDIITSAADERGRRTVLDLIGNRVPERIFPVGRLDRNTSGLLLLTNDGDLAEKLAHPSHKVQKVYQVTLDRPFHRNDFEKVQKGLKLDDGIAVVDSLHYVEERKDELEIGLHIGKNRIVRRIFEHLGYEVVKLDRTYYAGLTKKNIGRGHFRHLTEQEVIMLKHFK